MKIDDVKLFPKFLNGNADTYKYVLANARKNRKTSTQAETILWNELKGNKLGLHFRRQHVIGDYIADFVCLKCNLVIEVDGAYHDTEEQGQLDGYRTEYFKRKGLKVIRFTNEQVINDIESVMSIIIKNLL